jgi:hypothetical protein
MIFNYAENRLEILSMQDLMLTSKQIMSGKTPATAIILIFPFLFSISAQ